MIMVIVTFTIGGHGERYLCQTMQESDDGNFTGLQVRKKLLHSHAGGSDIDKWSLWGPST